MAYSKTNWLNDSLPAINAQNLNNIENGIKNNDDVIEKLKGGTTSQIIKKNSSVDFDFDWGDAGGGGGGNLLSDGSVLMDSDYIPSAPKSIQTKENFDNNVGLLKVDGAQLPLSDELITTLVGGSAYNNYYIDELALNSYSFDNTSSNFYKFNAITGAFIESIDASSLPSTIDNNDKFILTENVFIITYHNGSNHILEVYNRAGTSFTLRNSVNLTRSNVRFGFNQYDNIIYICQPSNRTIEKYDLDLNIISATNINPAEQPNTALYFHRTKQIALTYYNTNIAEIYNSDTMSFEGTITVPSGIGSISCVFLDNDYIYTGHTYLKHFTKTPNNGIFTKTIIDDDITKSAQENGNINITNVNITYYTQNISSIDFVKHTKDLRRFDNAVKFSSAYVLSRMLGNYSSGGINSVDISNYEDGSLYGAKSENSFVQGALNLVKDDNNHAQPFSVVMGYNCVSTGGNSSLIGHGNTSTFVGAFLFGTVLTVSADYQCAVGTYNEANSNSVFEVGNGISSGAKNSCMKVLKNGGLSLNQLPTVEPTNAGEVWNDAGTLKIKV